MDEMKDDEDGDGRRREKDVWFANKVPPGTRKKKKMREMEDDGVTTRFRALFARTTPPPNTSHTNRFLLLHLLLHTPTTMCP